ncbi:MAG: peptide deformylase [Lentisphaerae bacterium]|nr:peptide deformylase [Lentisphaerota bacterium]
MAKDKKDLTLRIIGDPVLHQIAKPVEKIDDSLVDLAQEMLNMMYKSNGIGLAAPQAGVSLRMFVLDVEPPEDEEGHPLPVNSPGEIQLLPQMPLAFINPEVTPIGTEESDYDEGCLSVPKLYATVRRPAKVMLKATLLDGREICIECGGLLARAIQHENDHLDGIVYVQKLEDKPLESIKKGLDKILKKNGKSNYKLKRLNKA